MTGIGRRLDRWRRGCGFDRNDLRREVDRVQWILGLFLLAGCVVVTSVACVRVGWAVYGSGVRVERQEAASLRRVDATVTGIEEAHSDRRVTVAWTEPAGTRRTSTYTTWRGVGPGDHLAVWAGDGTVRDEPPRPHTRTIGDTAAYELAAVSLSGMLFLASYMLLRRRCDRLRYARWDAAWADFDRHRIGP